MSNHANPFPEAHNYPTSDSEARRLSALRIRESDDEMSRAIDREQTQTCRRGNPCRRRRGSLYLLGDRIRIQIPIPPARKRTFEARNPFVCEESGSHIFPESFMARTLEKPALPVFWLLKPGKPMYGTKHTPSTETCKPAKTSGYRRRYSYRPSFDVLYRRLVQHEDEGREKVLVE